MTMTDNSSYDLEVECPRCGSPQPADGMGVWYCEECGFCAHPDLDGDVCKICGNRTELKKRLTQGGKE